VGEAAREPNPASDEGDPIDAPGLVVVWMVPIDDRAAHDAAQLLDGPSGDDWMCWHVSLLCTVWFA
jgi:hypothetical protein